MKLNSNMPNLLAGVVKLVDTPPWGGGGEIRAGSSPVSGTSRGFEKNRRQPVNLVFAGFFIDFISMVILHCPVRTSMFGFFFDDGAT